MANHLDVIGILVGHDRQLGVAVDHEADVSTNIPIDLAGGHAGEAGADVGSDRATLRRACRTAAWNRQELCQITDVPSRRNEKAASCFSMSGHVDMSPESLASAVVEPSERS